MTRFVRFPRLFLLSGLAAILSAGCDAWGRRGASPVADAVRPDLQAVLVSEAGGRDRFAAVAARYRAYLAHHPEDTEAHLEMGILLHDALGQSAEALYHFRTFLDAAPDSEKAALAREYIEKATERLVGDVSKAAAVAETDPTSREELTKHIESLNRKLSRMDADRASLSNQVASLERENAGLLADVASLRRMLADVRAGADVAAPGPRKVPELSSKTLDEPKTTRPVNPASSPVNRRGTYEVKRGDTLWGIAQLMYGDASRNTDIRKANPGKIGPNDSLTEGDVLIIP